MANLLFIRRVMSLSGSKFLRLPCRMSSFYTGTNYPQITATPDPSLFDSPLQITVKGLPPSKRITIYASTPSSKECIYESFAIYETSEKGIVDLSVDECLYGSYSGVEPTGLLWAMTAFSQRKYERFVKMDVTTPQVYHLHVFDEEILSLKDCRQTKKEKSVGSFLLNRWFIAPGVRRIAIRENGIVGTLFLPPGEGPFPGVINLFGGYPGVLEYKSALHASHGFASLALAYFGSENLPSSFLKQMDLNYFQKAINYMNQHENVNSNSGVGIVSICKGAQLALAMATYLKGIRCVVAVNGMCTSGFGSIKYEDKVIKADGPHLDRLEQNADTVDSTVCFDDPEVGCVQDSLGFFPFHKRRDVSFMLISGALDSTLNSSYYIDEMERLLFEENHPDYLITKYKNAGHLIEPPNFPFCYAYFQAGKLMNKYLSSGGKFAPHCRSQEDSWPKILSFLKSRLQSNQSITSQTSQKIKL